MKFSTLNRPVDNVLQQVELCAIVRPRSSTHIMSSTFLEVRGGTESGETRMKLAPPRGLYTALVFSKAHR